MTVDDWVLEAVEKYGKTGATLREVQRYIDEHHYEELAVDTLENSLETLITKTKLSFDGERWHGLSKTSREDALKKLFGDS